MTVIELAVGYLGVGAVCAGLALGQRAGTTVVDAVLLVGLWPVFGPVLAAARPADAGERGHLARLTAAEARLAQLDAALARPDLDEHAARARVVALEQRADGARAQAAARDRLHTIRRVRAVRAATAAEVEELREGLAQRRAHAELTRLGGDPDGNNPDPPDVGGSCSEDRRP